MSKSKKRERVVVTKPKGIKVIIRKFSRTLDKIDGAKGAKEAAR